jgi:hypothetical protein
MPMPAIPAELEQELHPRQPDLQPVPELPEPVLLPLVQRRRAVSAEEDYRTEGYQDPGEELQGGDSNLCRATYRTHHDPKAQLEAWAAQDSLSRSADLLLSA